MRVSRRAWAVPLGIVAAAVILGSGPAWSKGSRAKDGKDGTSALWIAADRVVGFVPFTVTLYGKVPGSTEPSRLEMCRDAPLQVDPANPRAGADDPMMGRTERANPSAAPLEPLCATGRLVRTQTGFDYTHEMRFDQPGSYRVRLNMVDAMGHHVISNTVQVNAF
jgi:hypothetical protein